MNQVDLNVSTLGAGKSVSSSSSTTTTSAEQAESEGFLSELQSLLFGSDDVEGKTETSSENSEEVDSTAKIDSDSSESTKMLLEAESDGEVSDEVKSSNAEAQLAEGDEFLSRLNNANQTLVSEDKSPAKSTNQAATEELGKTLPPSSDVLEQSRQTKTQEGDPEQLQSDEKMAALFGATAATDVDTKAAVKLQSSNGERLTSDSASKAVNNEVITQAGKESTQQALSSAGADSLQGATKAIPHGSVVATESKHTEAALMASTAAMGAGLHKNGEKIDPNTFTGQDGLAVQTASATAQQGIGAQPIKTDAQLAATQQASMHLSAHDASEKLSEKMSVMISKNLKHVDIRLDPPELGKMQIRLHMNNDQASVQFTVANAQARELIEQSLPRLRELMSQQGLQLADTDVQQQNRDQSGQYSYQKQEHVESGDNFSEESSEMVESRVQIRDPDKRISFYA